MCFDNRPIIFYLKSVSLIDFFIQLQVDFNPAYSMGRILTSRRDVTWSRFHRLMVQPIRLQCFPLFSIMLALNRSTIDYLSLDVEGSELDILKTIPYRKLDIKSISVEYAHVGVNGRQNVQEFLENRGYVKIAEVNDTKFRANDLIFVKKHLTRKRFHIKKHIPNVI